MTNKTWREDKDSYSIIMSYQLRHICEKWCFDIMGNIGDRWDVRVISNKRKVLFSEYLFKYSGDGVMFKLTFSEDNVISQLAFDYFDKSI